MKEKRHVNSDHLSMTAAMIYPSIAGNIEEKLSKSVEIATRLILKSQERANIENDWEQTEGL